MDHRHGEICLKHFPKACSNLLAMTEFAIRPIPEANLTTMQFRLPLTLQDNNVLQVIGSVEPQQWTVATPVGSVTFTPESMSEAVGTAIEIRLSGKGINPLYRGCIFAAQEDHEPAVWSLMLLEIRLCGVTTDQLTTEKLTGIITQML